MNDNRRAIAAKTRERDEFYTLEADVAREVSAYPGAFEGKSVYCNCDNPWLSGDGNRPDPGSPGPTSSDLEFTERFYGGRWD